MKKKVAFLGAGGHADAVYPMLDLLQYDFVGYFDDKDIKTHDGFPILGKINDVLKFLENKEVDRVFVTIGDNVKRKEIFEYVAKNHYDKIMNIISQKANVLTPNSIQGNGIFIGFGAFVGAKVVLKDNIVINTGAIVEHHSTIESHCNITPSVTVNGHVHLGEGVYMGSGSVVRNLKSIAAYTILGAGAVVTDDIIESGTYVGVPAKKIKGEYKV